MGTRLVTLGVPGGEGYTGPYDQLSNMILLLGLRKLRKAYTGNCVLLRRDSDNVEQAFGFTSQGWLDTAAITAWLSGSTAYIKTIYDQSGGGLDMTQTDAAKQAALTLNILNGHPVMRFAGGQGYASGNIDLSAVTQATVGAVAGGLNSGTDGAILEFTANGGVNKGFLLYRFSTGNAPVLLQGDNFSNFVNGAAWTTQYIALTGTLDRTLTSDEVTLWRDGTSSGSRTANANNTGGFANSVFNLGARNNVASLKLTGDIAEVYVKNGLLALGDRLALEANWSNTYNLGF